MVVSDDYVNRNSKIDGGEDYGGGRSGSSGSGGSSSSNGSHNDDLLYEERWTVISRNEFSGDCLTSNLMVDEDYWSRKRANDEDARPPSSEWQHGHLRQ